MKWIYKFLIIAVVLYLLFVLILFWDFFLTKKYIEENWVNNIDTETKLWFIKTELDVEPVQLSKLNIDINEILFYQKYYNKYKELKCWALTWKIKFERNYIIDLSTYEFNRRMNQILNNEK